MCVKFPATLNIQLKYICTKFVCTVILSLRKKILSGDAQCCNKDRCELLVRPSGRNLTQNGLVNTWLVAPFIICKPVMSTLDNRNELISGCRHSKKFLLNTVLTWLVLVANLTCCKHHLSTTRHAPTPRLAFIVLFYLMIRLARGMTL